MLRISRGMRIRTHRRLRVVCLVILVGIEAVEAHHVVDVATVQHVENRHHAHFLDGAASKKE